MYVHACQPMCMYKFMCIVSTFCLKALYFSTASCERREAMSTCDCSEHMHMHVHLHEHMSRCSEYALCRRRNRKRNSRVQRMLVAWHSFHGVCFTPKASKNSTRCQMLTSPTARIKQISQKESYERNAASLHSYTLRREFGRFTCDAMQLSNSCFRCKFELNSTQKLLSFGQREAFMST